MLMKAGPERISKNVPGIGGKSFEGTNHIISSLNNAAVPAIEKNSPISHTGSVVYNCLIVIAT